MSSEHKRFRKMVENSQDWFWEFDADANFTYASPRIKNLLGYEPEELIGLNAFDLMTSDEAERVRQHFDPIAKKYLPFNHLENTNIHKDGHEVVIESSGTPMFNEEGQFLGYRGIDRDITQRKRVEEELRKSQAKLQTIFDTSSEWIWEIDHSGDHTYSNQAIIGLLGYSPEDFIGKKYFSLLHEDDLREVKETLPQLIAEKRGWSGWVLRWRHQDGSYRFLESNANPIINDAGEVEGYCGVDRDITSRKKTEEALQTAKQKAEEASRAKSTFLANMSHEIRTPMIGIIGFSELLENSELTDKQKRYLATISSSADNLLSLINDILDISQIEAGKLKITPTTFSLCDCITEVTTPLKPKIINKGLSFVIDIPADLPDMFLGDPLRIKQILLNLLDNAIKFTNSGTISFSISVAMQSDSNTLLDISVEDTGCGIPEDSLEHIFKQFVQADDTTSRRLGGTGLGLTISQELAEMMGGSIHAESREGIGSIFILRLPLLVASEIFVAKDQPEASPQRGDGPTYKILLAEDNETSIQYTRSSLEMMGHEVSVVNTGKNVLETLSANDFDLVLMDIQLPEMNGDEVLRMIREQEIISKKHLPIIALTAYALAGDKEKYLNMDFDGYLSKPAMAHEIIDEIMRVLKTALPPITTP